MTHTYTITGMTCQGCKATVEEKLHSLPDVTSVHVQLESGTADVTMQKHLTVAQMQAVLPPKYTLTEKHPTQQETSATGSQEVASSKWQQLKPLFLILFYISVASLLMHYKDWNTQAFMLDFMGLFFVVFSFFKMLDLRGFSDSFRMYDPLAKRVPFYANVYPFIETALGLMFLMRFQVNIALWVTIIILGITTIGVTKTLLDKKSIRCACLGTALNLPMTEATFVENAIMLVMAATTLLSLL